VYLPDHEALGSYECSGKRKDRAKCPGHAVVAVFPDEYCGYLLQILGLTHRS